MRSLRLNDPGQLFNIRFSFADSLLALRALTGKFTDRRLIEVVGSRENEKLEAGLIS